MKFRSLFFMVIICGTILWSAYGVLSSAFLKETNIEIVKYLFNPCKPFEIEKKEKMAVLRVDDVQAYAWNNISKKMIEDALERSTALTLGIIPKGLYEDYDLYNFLLKNRCNIEAVVHGWDHQGDGEFANIDKKEAKDRFIKGRTVLRKLSGKEIISFIPPNNVISEEAIESLKEEGVKIISAGEEFKGDLDYHTSTYDFKRDVLVSTDTVIQDCENRFSKSAIDLCVIMIHPQDYSDESGNLDEIKYKEYIKLIDTLKEKEISAVRFKDIEKYLEEMNII